MSKIRHKAIKSFQVGVDASDKEIFTTLGKTTRLENNDGTHQVKEIRSPIFIAHVLNYTRFDSSVIVFLA